MTSVLRSLLVLSTSLLSVSLAAPTQWNMLLQSRNSNLPPSSQQQKHVSFSGSYEPQPAAATEAALNVQIPWQKIKVKTKNRSCHDCDYTEYEASTKAPEKTQRQNLIILPMAAVIAFFVGIVVKCSNWCREDVRLADEKFLKFAHPQMHRGRKGRRHTIKVEPPAAVQSIVRQAALATMIIPLSKTELRRAKMLPRMNSNDTATSSLDESSYIIGELSEDYIMTPVDRSAKDNTPTRVKNFIPTQTEVYEMIRINKMREERAKNRVKGLSAKIPATPISDVSSPMSAKSELPGGRSNSCLEFTHMLKRSESTKSRSRLKGVPLVLFLDGTMQSNSTKSPTVTSSSGYTTGSSSEIHADPSSVASSVPPNEQNIEGGCGSGSHPCLVSESTPQSSDSRAESVVSHDSPRLYHRQHSDSPRERRKASFVIGDNDDLVNVARLHNKDWRESSWSPAESVINRPELPFVPTWPHEHMDRGSGLTMVAAPSWLNGYIGHHGGRRKLGSTSSCVSEHMDSCIVHTGSRKKMGSTSSCTSDQTNGYTVQNGLRKTLGSVSSCASEHADGYIVPNGVKRKLGSASSYLNNHMDYGSRSKLASAYNWVHEHAGQEGSDDEVTNHDNDLTCDIINRKDNSLCKSCKQTMKLQPFVPSIARPHFIPVDPEYRSSPETSKNGKVQNGKNHKMYRRSWPYLARNADSEKSDKSNPPEEFL